MIEHSIGIRAERRHVNRRFAKLFQAVVLARSEIDDFRLAPKEIDERQKQSAIETVPVKVLGRAVRGRNEDKAAIEGDIVALREALEGEDVEAIQAKTQALAQSSMKLGEALYKANAGAEGGEDGPDSDGPGDSDGGAQTAGGDEGVVDAEFEEVDDDKKSKSA